MLHWVKANGGPLAIVVLGLGILGFTNPWVGVGLVGLGIVWFVLSLSAVQRRIPYTLQRRPSTRQELADQLQSISDRFTRIVRVRALRAADNPPPDERSRDWIFDAGDDAYQAETVALVLEDCRDELLDAMRRARDFGAATPDEYQRTLRIQTPRGLRVLRDRLTRIIRRLEDGSG